MLEIATKHMHKNEAPSPTSTVCSPSDDTRGKPEKAKLLELLPVERIDTVGVDRPRKPGTLTTVLLLVMAKKLKSKPMYEILKRLSRFQELDLCYLAEECMLSTDPDTWPRCDCLIAFNATNYPLEKALRYAQRVKPVLVNDLEKQFVIRDRCKVYKVLKERRIPVPKHVIVSDDPDKGDYSWDEIEERENCIAVKNGPVLMHRPFVEKPADADDHDIYIYFSDTDGGGCQKLFRKTNDRCSEYIRGHQTIRPGGTKVYEQFVATGGTDIKVYAVSGKYAHAEGRKAPVVDGKVLRDATGKEVRCPVLLSNSEKAMAREVVSAFGQTVCGFDLLRDQHGRSFVCDVNGWSFVKRAKSYFDDCAVILRKHISEQCRTSIQQGLSDSLVAEEGAEEMTETVEQDIEHVGVIAIIRHGERTPKQKAKLKTSMPEWITLYNKHDDLQTDSSPEIKLKSPQHLTGVMDVARNTIANARNAVDDGSITPEELAFSVTCKQVLERYPFQGINRKVQIKPIAWDEDSTMVSAKPVITRVQVILKWGGELTRHGLKMSEQEGEKHRNQFYIDKAGRGGLLRLHSTFRHDLKVYASDEGRVQTTAAAFAKGLLALDGVVPAILVTLVHKGTEANEWLDDCSAAKDEMSKVKDRLHKLMKKDVPASETRDALNPENIQSVAKALTEIETPLQALHQLKEAVENIESKARLFSEDNPERLLYDGEIAMHMHDRWLKCMEALYDPKKDKFNVSKVPDVYDLARYDSCHNSRPEYKTELDAVYSLSRSLAHIIIPQEYGMSRSEKLSIAANVTRKLRRKILYDLRVAANKPSSPDEEQLFQQEIFTRFNPQGAGFLDQKVKSPERKVRSRYYVTSESHLYGFLALLMHGGYTELVQEHKDTIPSDITSVAYKDENDPAELNGTTEAVTFEKGMAILAQSGSLGELTQIMLRVFERKSVPADSPDKHFVEWLLCTGQVPHEIAEPGAERQPSVSRVFRVHAGMPLVAVEEFMRNFGGFDDEITGGDMFGSTASNTSNTE